MRELIEWLCTDAAARKKFGERGLQTILERHTCGHRADQLLEIVQQ